MIYIKENEALLCKGDYHPAELYKGETRIAGFTKTEFSGESSVTLENCYNDKLYNAQIIGNSVQDGTPSPENPIEIQSVGELVAEGDYAGKYKIPVTARGKNVYKPTRFATNNILSQTTGANLENSRGTVINTTNAKAGELIVTQTTTNSEYDSTHYMNGFFCIETGTQLISGKKYTLSFDCEILESLLNTDDMLIFPNNHTPSAKVSVIDGRNSVEFTYHTNSGYNNFLHIRNAGKSLKISNIMITEQGYNSDYEPYIEPQTFDIYLNEPLRKVGNFADYIDFEKGKVVRHIRKNSISSLKGWGQYSSMGGFYRYEHENLTDKLFTETYSVNVLCNGLSTIAYNNNSDNSIAERYNHNRFRILTSEYATAAEMLAAFGDFNVHYILATPTEEEIELPKLPTFKGTTIYEIATSVSATINGMYKKVEV